MPNTCVCPWVAVALIGQTSITARADDWNARTRELYARMINTDTTAEHSENIVVLVKSIADDFAHATFAPTDIKVMPYDRTAALIVRWPAAHARARPMLLLAHLDVVTARAEDWTHQPFHLDEKDGYFYGRGTLDDKQGATSLVIALLELRSEGFRPDRDIDFFRPSLLLSVVFQWPVRSTPNPSAH